jgi:hypothetical protein
LPNNVLKLSDYLDPELSTPSTAARTPQPLKLSDMLEETPDSPLKIWTQSSKRHQEGHRSGALLLKLVKGNDASSGPLSDGEGSPKNAGKALLQQLKQGSAPEVPPLPGNHTPSTVASDEDDALATASKKLLKQLHGAPGEDVNDESPAQTAQPYKRSKRGSRGKGKGKATVTASPTSGAAVESESGTVVLGRRARNGERRTIVKTM